MSAFQEAIAFWVIFAYRQRCKYMEKLSILLFCLEDSTLLLFLQLEQNLRISVQ